MTRTEITSLMQSPAHLRPAVGAALAAKLRVSLWTVRELTVVHVNDGGTDGWRIWMPIERDSDALECFTRIGMQQNASMSMHGNRVTATFGIVTASHTAYARDYHGDMGAALRGAITNAALRLCKHEQTDNLV